MIIFAILFIVILSVGVFLILPPEILREGILSILSIAGNNETNYFRILKQDPKNIKALKFLGSNYFTRGDYKESYNYYSRLIIEITNNSAYQTNIDSFESYLRFGISAYYLDKESEALTSLQKARIVIPSSNTDTFDLFYYMGLIYYQKKDYNNSILALGVAHEQKPENKEIAYILAVSYYNLRKFDLACPLLSDLADSENPGEIEFYLGICLIKLQQLEAAIIELELAARNPVYQFRSWHEIARIYIEQKFDEKALEVCKNIIEQENNETASCPIDQLCFAYYQSAKLLVKTGLLDSAINMLDRLLEIDDSYEDAKILQKYYLENQENPQLFKLLEGNNELRIQVFKQLIELLIPGAQNIKVIQAKSLLLEASTFRRKYNSQYYVWVSLENSPVSMHQVSDLYAKSKKYDCSYCVLVSMSGFSPDTDFYVKQYSIRLVSNEEFKECISQTIE